MEDEEHEQQLLKDQTDKVKEKIKEEAPKWKEKLDQGIEDVKE